MFKKNCRWGIHYAWKHHGAVIEGAAGMTIAAGGHLIPFHLDFIGFHLIPLDWIALDPFQFHWIQLHWIPFTFIGSIGLYWLPKHLC